MGKASRHKIETYYATFSLGRASHVSPNLMNGNPDALGISMSLLAPVSVQNYEMGDTGMGATVQQQAPEMAGATEAADLPTFGAAPTVMDAPSIAGRPMAGRPTMGLGLGAQRS